MQFIELILTKELLIQNKSKASLLIALKANKLKSIEELRNKYNDAFVSNTTDIVSNQNEQNNEQMIQSELNVKTADLEQLGISRDNTSNGSTTLNTKSNENFDYLMNMNFWNLTYEKVNELEIAIQKLIEQIEDLQAKSEIDLWKYDLNQLLTEFDVRN